MRKEESECLNEEWDAKLIYLVPIAMKYPGIADLS